MGRELRHDWGVTAAAKIPLEDQVRAICQARHWTCSTPLIQGLGDWGLLKWKCREGHEFSASVHGARLRPACSECSRAKTLDQKRNEKQRARAERKRVPTGISPDPAPVPEPPMPPMRPIEMETSTPAGKKVRQPRKSVKRRKPMDAARRTGVIT